MGLTVGEAAARTGWSARMLRYLEGAGLVVPARTPAGYRLYGLRELNQLRSLRDLRRRFGLELTDVAFAAGSGASPSSATPSTTGSPAARRRRAGSSGSSASTSGSRRRTRPATDREEDRWQRRSDTT